MRREAHGIDILDMHSLLNEEERSIQQTMRQWLEDHVRPRIVDLWRSGEQPKDLYPQFAELGLLGASLPEPYGGAMKPRAYGLVMKELERIDSCIRSMVSVQNNLCMYPIWQFGSEKQKANYLPSMVKGAMTGCFCLSEPDAGSDPAAMRTVAEKNHEGYIINGTKRWITNGTNADICIVWARVPEENNRICGFIVDAKAQGLTRLSIQDKLSFRASDTAELIFEDVQVSQDNRLPDAIGLGAALSVLNQARYGIVWGVLGAAEDCLETALSFVSERNAFGKPLSGFQLIQKKCAEMASELAQGHLLAYRLSELKEDDKIQAKHVSLGKMNNVDMALRIARTCREMLGANGIMDEYPIMRHLCNLETVYTYEGTHDIHMLVLGQVLTGQNAFR